jgi:RNA polymerase sigma-70 factor (ECF subfamily)
MEKIILTNKREIIPFPELYDKYSLDIYRYALSILKDSDDAKDAVQETFVKYVENELSFRGDASQKTWLLIVARNYCYSRLKRAEKSNIRIDEEVFDKTYEPEYDSEITLKDALMCLSVGQNELLFLKEYGGYSYKEIADITELSIENVKIKLFRARQQLREIIKGGK